MSNIKEFIGDTVFYDRDSGMIFGQSGDKLQHIADVRGMGVIANLFDNDMDKAFAFQDELAQFIAEAIQEKLTT